MEIDRDICSLCEVGDLDVDFYSSRKLFKLN